MKRNFFKQFPPTRMLLMLVLWVSMGHMSWGQPFFFSKGTVTPATPAGTLTGATTYNLTPYTGTVACMNQSSTLWCGTAVNFTRPFSVNFQSRFDMASSFGADGMCLVFGQGINPPVTFPAGSGGILGYVTPPPLILPQFIRSFAVEFDNFNNGGGTFCDIMDDHMAIDTNGRGCSNMPNVYGPLPTPTDPLDTNIEDNVWRSYQVIWDPGTQSLLVYCNCRLRINSRFDYDSVFTTPANVFWGFTAATGTSCSNQWVRDITLNYLPVADTADTVCQGACTAKIFIAPALPSPIVTSYYWRSSTGATSVASSISAPCLTGTNTYHSISYNHDDTIGSCAVILTTHRRSVVSSTILGPNLVCLGSTITLSNSVGGGTWTTSHPSVASVSSSGVVTGAGLGTAIITYTVAGCTATHVVTVYAPPAPIAGPSTVCVGNSITLTNAAPGGSWNSSHTSIAAVSPGGVVTGGAAGTAVITYAIGSCNVTHIVTVNPLPQPIGGSLALCLGVTGMVTDATPGGTWVSSNVSVGSIDILSGAVVGMGLGTTVITYTLPTGCLATAVLTVNVVPDPLAGPGSVCVGSSITLVSGPAGGIWSSSSPTIASVAPSTGVVAGVSAGTAAIIYTLSGCSATAVVTVEPLPTPILAPMICLGQTVTMTAGVPGGTWTSSTGSVATVDPVTGVATGHALGTTVMTYVSPAGCVATQVVTVAPVPDPITGPTEVCTGQTIVLSDAVPGGTWMSGAPGIATVNVTTGVVTGGPGTGTATITYSIGTCWVTYIVTVHQTPAITGTAVICVGMTTTLSGAPFGGSWFSSSPGIGDVNIGTGAVLGVAPGTTIIKYVTAEGCAAYKTVTVTAVPGIITGTRNICISGITTLSNSVPGGTWSTPPAIPPVIVVNPTTGMVFGTFPGTATVIYTAPGGACSATTTVTVDILPPAVTILPVTSVYEGCNYTLTGAPGIVSPGTTVSWTLMTSTPGSSLGVPVNTALTSTVSFTAGSPGVIQVRYTLTNACGTRTVTRKFEIMPKPIIKTAKKINLCKGDMTTVSAGPSGGTWTTGDPLIADVTPGGVVTGVGVGSTTLTYTLSLGSAGCTAVGYTVVNVHPAPTPISGILVICDSGATTTLTNGEPGGIWTSSDPSVASVDPVTGVVTGHSTGTTTITYELPPWECIKTAVVSVMIGAPACVCSEYVPAGGIFNELDPMHTGTISGVIPSGNYFLNHDIVIHSGTTVDLTNCVVVMSPAVKITVNSSALMEVVHSHLFCCRPDMWQGIVLSTDISGGGSGATGQLILINNKLGSTLVEDARVAVDIPSPQPMPGYSTAGALTSELTLYASGVTFNRNNRGIRINNAAMPAFPISGSPTTLHPSYPFVVQNAVFTSRDLTVFPGWPYAWPRNDGSVLVGALKAPYTPTPANPYIPPYLLETYTQVSCNMGGIPTSGIELVDVGTTTGTGIGTYSGVVIGSASSVSGVATRNIFDNMRNGIAATNSNLASRNSAYMHMKSTLVSVTGISNGNGIVSRRDGAGALANKKIGLDVYGNASGYRNEFWDCRAGVKAQDLYVIRGMYSQMSSRHSTLIPGDIQGRAGYEVSVSEFFDIQLNNNAIYNIRSGIICQVVPPAADHSLFVGQITASRNLISANTSLSATMAHNEYVHTGITVQALIYPYSGGIVSGSQVNVDQNSLAYVYNGIVLTGFDQDHQIKTTRINAILLRPDAMVHLPYQQAGILHANNLRDYIQTNLVMGPGYNVPMPAATYTSSLTTTRTLMEGIHGADLRSTYICNNLLRDINTGFYFDGASNLAWVGNMMMNNAYGYVLHGNISPQPLSYFGSPTDVTGNFWQATGGFSWASNWQTYTIGSLDLSMTTGSGMHVDATPVVSLPVYNGTEGGTAYSTAPGGGIDVATGTITTPLCELPDPTTIPIVYREAGSKKRNAVTGKSWISQMHTWKTVAGNDAMGASAELYTFRQLAANSRYKYLTDIENDIAIGNYAHAQQLLAQPLNYMASDASDPEANIVLADKAGDNIVSNYKQYYSLLIKYRADKLSNSDSEQVVALAEKCPLVDGSVIFQARALYNLVFDDCRIFSDLGCKLEPEQDASQTAGATTAVNSENADGAYKIAQVYTLYPNPSDGDMTLTQKVPDNEPVKADVWNAAGASIFKGELHFKSGIANLKMMNTSAGIYILQLIDSKGNRSTLKFVISGQ